MFFNEIRIFFPFAVCVKVVKSDFLLSDFYFSSSFYLYTYLSDLQESNGGAICRASNYPNLLLKMPRYCCLLGIFYLFF